MNDNSISTAVPDQNASLRIILAGGNGHLGSLLANHFLQQGHAVTTISRRFAPTSDAAQFVHWDGQTLGPWIQSLENSHVLINLAGRSVNCRYTPRNRRQILDSRIRSTRILGEAVARLHDPPKVWLNFSTATIYRHSFDKPMDEFSGEIGGHEHGAPAGWRFSIDVARRWEEVFFAAKTSTIRKIALRSAMVMSTFPDSVFDILSTLCRFGLAGAAGDGRQFVSWIHEFDFLRALDFLIRREEISGVVNIASPNPLPNTDFMRAIRNAYHRRFGLSGAPWMLEIAAFFHRTETELLLKSRRVVPARLLEAGYTFQYPEWQSAARELAARWLASSEFPPVKLQECSKGVCSHV